MQHNPKSSSCQTHHVDPTVACGKQQGLPREIRCASRKGLSVPQGGLTAHRKSAEGIVGGGKARLVRHSIRKGEQQIGQAAKAAVEGPNGAPAEWWGKWQWLVGHRLDGNLVRTDALVSIGVGIQTPGLGSA